MVGVAIIRSEVNDRRSTKTKNVVQTIFGSRLKQVVGASSRTSLGFPVLHGLYAARRRGPSGFVSFLATLPSRCQQGLRHAWATRRWGAPLPSMFVGNRACRSARQDRSVFGLGPRTPVIAGGSPAQLQPPERSRLIGDVRPERDRAVAGLAAGIPPLAVPARRATRGLRRRHPACSGGVLFHGWPRLQN